MIVSYPAMEHKKALFLRPDKRDFTAEDSNGTTARKGGHGLYFPDDDPHDDHDNVEPSHPKDPYDYHHNGDGGLYFPE